MVRPSWSWWFMLPVGLCFILNSVGLGLIYSRLTQLDRQSPPASPPDAPGKESQILERLDLIQAQLAQIQSNATTVLGAATPTSPSQLSDLLPDLSNTLTNTSQRYLSISKDITDSVKIYKEQADFSPIVGYLVPDYKYPYSTKLNNWYRVELSGDITGWVKADYVREVL